ncbi:methylated-DNA--[protein]-cysteine S-methyltransferase [Candidatus Altiarchaeota archaeon]
MDEGLNVFKTRLGWMGFKHFEDRVSRIYLPQGSRSDLLEKYGLTCDLGAGFDVLKDSLNEYIEGDRRTLESFEADLSGSTDFERKVYEETMRIPYGKTKTYGDIAKSVGKPLASRAVGNALSKNPLPLLIPCHRVLGSKGLGGFTPSIDLKKKLLKMEGVL